MAKARQSRFWTLIWFVSFEEDISDIHTYSIKVDAIGSLGP